MRHYGRVETILEGLRICGLPFHIGLRCVASKLGSGSIRCKAERIHQFESMRMRAGETPGAKSRMVLPECYPKLLEVIP